MKRVCNGAIACFSQAHQADVERAASLMSFFLSLGLALGAGASIFTVYYFMI
jgi:hypothetical protein